MASKFKPKKFSFFVILFFLVFSLTYVFAETDRDYSFEIPTEPLRIVGGDFKTSGGSSSSSSSSSNTNSGGFQGNIRNEFIYCLMNQSTDIIDSIGRVIDTENSRFFGGNPWTTFALTDEKTNKEIDEGGFGIEFGFKCQTSGEAIPESGIDEGSFGAFNFPSVEIPLTVEPAELVVKVFSRDSNGKLIETWNGILETEQTKITSSNANTIGTVNIQSKDILKFLPDGEYQSWQHITVSGEIDVHWTNFPDPSYRYTIETTERFGVDGTLSEVDGDLITFRLINVDKQTDSQPPTKKPGDCKDNEVFENGFCIKLGGGDSNNNFQQINQATDFVNRLALCWSTQGINCALHQDFIGLTLFGIAGVIGLFAVGTKAANKPDIYGVPA